MLAKLCVDDDSYTRLVAQVDDDGGQWREIAEQLLTFSPTGWWRVGRRILTAWSGTPRTWWRCRWTRLRGIAAGGRPTRHPLWSTRCLLADLDEAERAA